MIIGYNSDNPDTVVMVATSDIPEGVTIYMTDNAWTGSTFRSNEGTVKLTTPVGGIPKGKIVTFGDNSLYNTPPFTSLWENDRGNFALSTSGEGIFVYCLTDEDDASSFSHLTALTYVSTEVSVPSALSPGTFVQLSHIDNRYYDGERNVPSSQLRSLIANTEKWSGTNSDNIPSDRVLQAFTFLNE